MARRQAASASPHWRLEPRAGYGSTWALVAGLKQRNGWSFAKRAGEIGPGWYAEVAALADWDVGGVRDNVRDYVVEREVLVTLLVGIGRPTRAPMRCRA